MPGRKINFDFSRTQLQIVRKCAYRCTGKRRGDRPVEGFCLKFLEERLPNRLFFKLLSAKNGLQQARGLESLLYCSFLRLKPIEQVSARDRAGTGFDLLRVGAGKGFLGSVRPPLDNSRRSHANTPFPPASLP